MGAIEFGLAALIALAAQFHLIEGLFLAKHRRRSTQMMTIIAVVLIGMGVGTLGTSVFMSGDKAAVEAKP
jgi:hypothetical protein